MQIRFDKGIQSGFRGQPENEVNYYALQEEHPAWNDLFCAVGDIEHEEGCINHDSSVVERPIRFAEYHGLEEVYDPLRGRPKQRLSELELECTPRHAKAHERVLRVRGHYVCEYLTFAKVVVGSG